MKVIVEVNAIITNISFAIYSLQKKKSFLWVGYVAAML